jgi:hypothetical protein
MKPKYLTFCIEMALKRPGEQVISPGVFRIAQELFELDRSSHQ